MTKAEAPVFDADARHPGGGEPGESNLLSVALSGDRAMVENVILEVRALAQKFGLKIPNVTVVSESAIVPKKAIPASEPVGDPEGDRSERAQIDPPPHAECL